MNKEIIYISRAIDNNLYKQFNLKTNIAATKFNYSIIKGLTNYFNVNVLYVFDSFFKTEQSVQIGKIKYNFTPKYSLIKRTIYLIRKLLHLHKKKGTEYILIADALCFGDAFIALFFSKLFSWKSIGIFTDLPEYLSKNNSTIKNKIKIKLLYSIFSFYNYYVLLTDAMKSKIPSCNQNNSIVIEGFADTDVFDNLVKHKKNQVLYAGTLHKEYGIDTLIKAFDLFSKENKKFNLVIYGKGNYEQQIINYSKVNSQIIYKGEASLDDILQEEVDSILLVNPRHMDENNEDHEYIRFSFPSKNIEYMCSGTPMLASKLPGMPDEYLNYIFEIKDCTVQGLCNSLKEVLNLNEHELQKIGEKAKKFMIQEKNYNSQVKKILKRFDLIKMRDQQ